MSAHSRFAMLAGAVVLVAGAPARAQVCPEPQSPEEARVMARENFNAAQEAYEMGRPLRALAHYQCSYQLVPHHNTLYNIGILAESLSELETARDAYRTYLAEFPDADARDDVRRRLSDVEGRLAALGTDPTSEPPPPAQSPPLAETPPPAETPPSIETPPPAETPPAETPPAETLVPVEPPPATEPQARPVSSPEGGMTTGRIMAFVTLGLGVVVGGTGGALFGVAASRASELEEEIDSRQMSRSELNDMADTGYALELAGWVLMGAGAALLATSLALYVAVPARRAVAGGRSERSQVTLAPVLAGDVAGLALGGTF